VLALGRRIAASIPGEGSPPALLALLPREGLEAGRVRAFHDHLVLRYHLPLFRENVLRLDRETAVVLAPYREPAPGAGSCWCATPARGAPRRRGAPSPPPSWSAAGARGGPGRGGRLDGARRSGDVLAVVLGAPSEEAARRLLDGAAAGGAR